VQLVGRSSEQECKEMVQPEGGLAKKGAQGGAARVRVLRCGAARSGTIGDSAAGSGQKWYPLVADGSPTNVCTPQLC
jgi:hypothetical protein